MDSINKWVGNLVRTSVFVLFKRSCGEGLVECHILDNHMCGHINYASETWTGNIKTLNMSNVGKPILNAPSFS